MVEALRNYQQNTVPQSEPLDERQVQNNAGGYVYAIDDWSFLNRFLTIGTEGGTYYVGEDKLTRENAQNVEKLIKEDGKRVVDAIVEISRAGRAPKNDYALFALAMAAGTGDTETRKYALSVLPNVARTATHLFLFVGFVRQFRGWGRLLREAVASWYTEKEDERLAYQIMKYPQRYGYSHAQTVKLSHPVPGTEFQKFIFSELRNNGGDTIPAGKAGEYVEAVREARSPGITVERAIQLIGEYSLTHEMIANHVKSDPDLWFALLQNMPIGAMIRNLGRMTANGVLAPFSDGTKLVVDRLTDSDRIKYGRIHPIVLMDSAKVYNRNIPYRSAVRSSLDWNPVGAVSDALEEAFYLAFGTIEGAGQNVLMGLDISGSMGMTAYNTLTAAEIAAVMAMASARAERHAEIYGFSNTFKHLPITRTSRLDEVLRVTQGATFGSTDCAQPMVYAMEQGWNNVDTFAIYTDMETWFGRIHPMQALRRYREKYNSNAKLVTVAIVSSPFSIADPNDRGTLDVSGFDSSTPVLISEFMRGNI